MEYGDKAQSKGGPLRSPVNTTAALHGFFRIMDLWGVGPDAARTLLGAPPQRTFYMWKRGEGVRVPNDTLRRIGYIAGIYSALQIVYSEAPLADQWIRRPNKFFGGQAPLQRMTAGDVTDLAAVRAYLDSARAPWK